MSAFPQRILVPTDLSDFSRGAAAWALMFQRRLGSRITLLYANQPYFAVNALEGPAAYALPATPDVKERMVEEPIQFAVQSHIIHQAGRSQQFLIPVSLAIASKFRREQTGFRKMVVGAADDGIGLIDLF